MRFDTQLIVLELALALDLLLGDPPNRFHPVAWMGHFIGWGERLAPDAGPGITFIYGAAWVLFGVLVCTLPVVGLLAGAKWVGDHLYIPLAALLLKSTFT
jgi:adenosylcobinamide-phosphate synthase